MQDFFCDKLSIGVYKIQLGPTREDTNLDSQIKEAWSHLFLNAEENIPDPGGDLISTARLAMYR